MKNYFLAVLICLGLCLTACQQEKAKTTVEPVAFETEIIVLEDSIRCDNDWHRVHIEIQAPVDSTSELSKQVCSWINERMAGSISNPESSPKYTGSDLLRIMLDCLSAGKGENHSRTRSI